jgi:hypothetical protein
MHESENDRYRDPPENTTVSNLTTVTTEPEILPLKGTLVHLQAGWRVVREGGESWKPGDKYSVVNEKALIGSKLTGETPVYYRVKDEKNRTAEIVVDTSWGTFDNVSTNQQIEQQQTLLKLTHGGAIGKLTRFQISLGYSARKHYGEAPNHLPGSDNALRDYVLDRLSSEEYVLSESDKHKGELQVDMKIAYGLKWSVIGSYDPKAATLSLFHYGPGG